jgi:Protein of unknown function (DUF3616)
MHSLPLAIETTLDLDGMGIRGMCYDEKRRGYWIIAGLAPDPDESAPNLQNDWSIWFWNGKDEPHKRWQKAKLPADVRLNNPEAISVVRSREREDSLLIISDDDSFSSYVLVPISKLE